MSVDFGLPWILAFDMKLPPNLTIRKVESQEGKPSDEKFNVKKIIRDFKEVFSKELGKLKGHQVKMHLKEDSKSKHFVARRFPFKSRKKVENDL